MFTWTRCPEFYPFLKKRCLLYKGNYYFVNAYFNSFQHTHSLLLPQAYIALSSYFRHVIPIMNPYLGCAYWCNYYSLYVANNTHWWLQWPCAMFVNACLNTHPVEQPQKIIQLPRLPTQMTFQTENIYINNGYSLDCCISWFFCRPWIHPWPSLRIHWTSSAWIPWSHLAGNLPRKQMEACMFFKPDSACCTNCMPSAWIHKCHISVPTTLSRVNDKASNILKAASAYKLGATCSYCLWQNETSCRIHLLLHVLSIV